MHELELRERRSAALAAELVEARVQLRVGAPVLVPVGGPVRLVVARVARERGRQPRVLHLGGVAGHDPHPGPARGGQGGKRDDVVLDDHVRLELVDDLRQPLVHVLRPVDERLEGGRDEVPELLDRRLAKDRRRLADEVLPELACVLLLLGGRSEAHQALLEALLLESARERLLDDEHDSVAAPAQHVADADAVVGRPVGALGEEDDRGGQASSRRRPSPARSPARRSAPERPLPRLRSWRGSGRPCDVSTTLMPSQATKPSRVYALFFIPSPFAVSGRCTPFATAATTAR